MIVCHELYYALAARRAALPNPEPRSTRMRPTKTPRTTNVYKLPGGTEANDLPVERVPVPGCTWLITPPGGDPVPVAGPGRYTWNVTDDDTGKSDEITLEAQPSATAVRSAWLLTDDDLAAIAQTGLLELTIWGEPIPPVALAVIEVGATTDYGWGPENTQPEPPISRQHANLAIGSLYVQLLEHFASPRDAESLEADEFLAMWHKGLAETSAGDVDGRDPDARPAQDHRDPREAT